jgi:glucose-6-phosphate isomerase
MNGWIGTLPEPEIRTAAQMRTVLADPSCPYAGPLYYMYRGIARDESDRRWLAAHHLRYDVTRIPGRDVCGEFVKTKGHFHPPSPEGTGYPEIYEVLAGLGHYLLQRRDAGDIIVVEAGVGEKVVVPPGYGHVTINPATEELVMANIVSTEFSGDYSLFEHCGGAAYFEMQGRIFVRNPRYSHAPPVRHGEPIRSEEWGIPPSTALYALIGNATALAFLNSPSKAELQLRRIAEG